MKGSLEKGRFQTVHLDRCRTTNAHKPFLIFARWRLREWMRIVHQKDHSLSVDSQNVFRMYPECFKMFTMLKMYQLLRRRRFGVNRTLRSSVRLQISPFTMRPDGTEATDSAEQIQHNAIVSKLSEKLSEPFSARGRNLKFGIQTFGIRSEFERQPQI